MKKFFIAIAIILALTILGVVHFKYSVTEFYLKRSDDIITELRRETSVKFDNNNIPKYAKDFIFADDFDLKKSFFLIQNNKYSRNKGRYIIWFKETQAI